MKPRFLALALLVSSALGHAQLLTTFGSSDFTVDADFTNMATSQTSTTLTFSGNDGLGNTVSGSFVSPFTLNDASTAELTLEISVSGTNPNSPFHIDFYNSDFSSFYRFTGTTTNATSTLSPTSLAFDSLNGGSFTSFTYAQFIFDGPGTPITSMSLGRLEAVPEPATWMLLAGSMTTVMLLRRRRNARA